MKAFYAFFDKITSKIPVPMMRMIRLGALLVWAVFGTVIVFFSWRRGEDATPPQGQDLSIATIRERIQREENRKQTGDVTVPDLGEFFPESSSPDLPRTQLKRQKPGLSGEDSKLIEPENVVEQPGTLPPFLGEDVRNEYPLRIPEPANTRKREETNTRQELKFKEEPSERTASERTERSERKMNDREEPIRQRQERMEKPREKIERAERNKPARAEMTPIE